MNLEGRRAVEIAGEVQRIGFVEFTTDLVRNVYQTLVQGSLEQLMTYGEFVQAVAEPLADYQNRLVGAVGSAEATRRAEDYITNVLNLPAGDPVPLTQEQRDALVDQFRDINLGAAGAPDTIDGHITPAGAQFQIPRNELIRFVVAKLRQDVQDHRTLLIAVLRLGMQKLVLSQGEILTKLTFHVDTRDIETQASRVYDRNRRNWGIGGHGLIGGAIGFLGVSGGYRSNRLTVSVVNESASAATNVNVDIVGSVKLVFRSETFPAVSPN